jgi:hypothetical protein
MVKCGVLFEVRAEFLSTIYTSFGLKGLTESGGEIKIICTLFYLSLGQHGWFGPKMVPTGNVTTILNAK